MSFDLVIGELQLIYRDNFHGIQNSNERISDAHIDEWAAKLTLPRADLCDKIACYLAVAFHNNEAPFAFCDAIINDIQSIMLFSGEEYPEFFWRVFLAFDAGEYFHGGNADEDPIDAHTRPMIADIIAGTG